MSVAVDPVPTRCRFWNAEVSASVLQADARGQV